MLPLGRLVTIAPFRPFRATVSAVEDLTPHLRRIRFGGPDLAHFGDPGWDQRIKLVVPRSSSTFRPFDLADELQQDWYAGWLALPDEIRPQLRTYTTRRVVTTDAGRAVDVDVVLHEHSGPAGDWARSAQPGDELLLVGPDARYGDSPGGRAFLAPRGVEHVVLAGDETALPAVARILEDLADCVVGLGPEGPPAPRVSAFVEVPTADDTLDLRVGRDVTLTWLPREGAPTGELLDGAVREWALARAAMIGARDVNPGPLPVVREDPGTLGHEGAEPHEDAVWDVPDEPADLPSEDAAHRTRRASGVLGDVYLWIAAESSVVKGIRRHLVNGLGVDRERVAFMGYWKRGASL